MTAERPSTAQDTRKLTSLLEMGKALHEAADLDALLTAVIDMALRATGAGRGFLFLLEGTPGERRLACKVSRVLLDAGGPGGESAVTLPGLTDDPCEPPVPLLRAALERARPVVLAGDPEVDGALGAAGLLPGEGSSSDSAKIDALPPALLVAAQEHGHRSIVCVPLRGRERALGAVYLDSRRVRGLFGEREVDLVVAFAAQAGLAIENARGRDELARKNRLLHETQARLVQSAKMSAVGQLAAGVSHEIRNPLNVISGSIYVLKERLRAHADAKVQEYLAHVESEVRRAAVLTEKLLDFARPPGALEPVCVNEVVRRSLALVAKLAERRDVAVIEDLAPELPPVLASASELQQVVVNLALNGAQACPGAGRVVVRTRAEADAVLVDVNDDGRGISPADRERLFEPFFTRREGGTGLGLYVSWGIVERHGGRISVESAPGAGTTFTVRLPLGGGTGGDTEDRPATPAVAATAA